MKDGGSAFPVFDRIWDPVKAEIIVRTIEYGMSLRDWFAGLAMAGICSDPSIDANSKVTAEVSYAMVDAMLARREAGKWAV